MFAARASSTRTSSASASTTIRDKFSSSFSRCLSALNTFRLLRRAPLPKAPGLRLLLLAEKHSQAQAQSFARADPYNPLSALDVTLASELEPVEPLPACFVPVIMVSTSTSFHSLSSAGDVAAELKRPATAAPVPLNLLTVPASAPTLEASRHVRTTTPARKTTPATARSCVFQALYADASACPPTPHVRQERFPTIVRASDVFGKPSLSPESIRAGLSTLAEPEITAPWCASPPARRAAPPSAPLPIGMPASSAWNGSAQVPRPRPLLSAQRAALGATVVARMHERKACSNTV